MASFKIFNLYKDEQKNNFVNDIKESKIANNKMKNNKEINIFL